MKPNNRLGTVSVGALQLLLTPRDIAIIRLVREYKFLSTRQIYALHFGSHASYASGIRACTRVLTRLHQHRLLYRLARTVGGGTGGSTSYVWSVGAAGDRLLRADPETDYVKRFRAFEPTPLFLAHTLAIADLRVRLNSLARDGRLELLSVMTEPANWRPFSLNGRSQILKPDLYIVTASGDDEWHRYVEWDTGTESFTALTNKCLIYQNYAATGTDQRELGVVPQVLWLVPNETRAKRFAETIEHDRRLDVRLHRVITPSSFEAELSGDPITNRGLVPQKGGL